MEKIHQYEVVVGIDSGFSYSFYNKNDINHDYIWENVNNKVATEIIIDDNYNI